MSEKTQDLVANSSLIAGSGYGLQQQYGGIWDGQAMVAAPRSVGKVYASILQVMDEIGRVGIAKDREVSFGQKYKFRGIEDALNALNTCLVQAKIVIIPYVVSCDMSRNDKTNICKMVVDYKIVNVEDGSSAVMRIATEAFASGDDKGPGKALSYAYKSGMFQLFCIPTEPGTLPDQDEEKPSRDRRRGGDYGFGGEYGQDDSHHAPPRRQETKPESRSEKRPSQNAAPRQGQTQTVPRMKGNEKTYAHAGKFANELTDELLYSRIRQLAHMKNLSDYAGMPEHLAELKKYAATRGIVNFDRKTEEAYPPEIPEHLYVCVMPGKASFQKDIRSEELTSEMLTKYLIMLEGDSRLANKPERIKLVQQELQVRLSRDADRQDAENRTMP